MRNAEALGQPSEGSSNSFEPAGDRPSNLVGTVLLHEVKTSDDNVVLITLRAFLGRILQKLCHRVQNLVRKRLIRYGACQGHSPDERTKG